MSLYKTNVLIKIYNAMICIHQYTSEFMKREQNAFGHDGYSMDQYTPQGGWKQQQHDDSANGVLQFINEEISVMMRNRLEMEGKSYSQEVQQLS